MILPVKRGAEPARAAQLTLHLARAIGRRGDTLTDYAARRWRVVGAAGMPRALHVNTESKMQHHSLLSSPLAGGEDSAGGAAGSAVAFSRAENSATNVFHLLSWLGSQITMAPGSANATANSGLPMRALSKIFAGSSTGYRSTGRHCCLLSRM